jgi:hypothetical protein
VLVPNTEVVLRGRRPRPPGRVESNLRTPSLPPIHDDSLRLGLLEAAPPVRSDTADLGPAKIFDSRRFRGASRAQAKKLSRISMLTERVLAKAEPESH